MLFQSCSYPPGLGCALLIMNSWGTIAQVKVVGRRRRSWPAGHNGSENWVTGISQLTVNVFSILFEFLRQSFIMNSTHTTIAELKSCDRVGPTKLLATLQNEGADPWTRWALASLRDWQLHQPLMT